MPDVSVVIPTYNRMDYLRQAIASCFAGNEGIDVEVVVVDDGSTDGTRDYLQQVDDERVRPIFQEHQGAQVARNRGLSGARGEFVKFLDDDDWLAEGALTMERDRLRQADADVVYGGYQFVESDGTCIKTIEATAQDDYVAALLDERILTHPLRFTYRRAFIKGIVWDTGIPARQDLAFAFAVGARLPNAVSLSEVVGYFRQHQGERVSTRASEKDNPPRLHAEILTDTVKQLHAEGKLNEKRRTSAARGLWTWAYLIAMQDWSMFERMYGLVQTIAPDFQPERSNKLLTMLDQTGSPYLTERITYPVRKAKDWLIGP